MMIDRHRHDASVECRLTTVSSEDDTGSLEPRGAMAKGGRRRRSKGSTRGGPSAAAAHDTSKDDMLVVYVQRGTTPRQRHLVRDLGTLLSHARFGDKLPRRVGTEALLDACYLSECGMRALFLSARFEDEMCLWLVRLPHGPSVRFHVLNIHTIAECNFGYTPFRVRHPCLLSFDASFDGKPHLRLMRELLRATFSCSAVKHDAASSEQRAQCGFQTVVAFNLVDDRIWLRAYDVVFDEDGRGCAELRERGPRLVLTPQKVLTSVLQGAQLWASASHDNGT